MNTSDLNTMTIVDRINNVSDNTNLTGTDDDVVLAKIEVSSICKFNCSFCSRQYIRSNDPDRLDKNMDLDTLKDIITTLKSRYKNLKEIGLFYMGESGFNPNLKEMYKYLKDNGYFTFLTTNASYIKYILEAIPYIDSLKVSWNYTDIEDFNKKTNASYKYQDFMDLIDNIDKLYYTCHKYGKTLSVSTILDDVKNTKAYEQQLNGFHYDFHYYIPLQNNGGYLEEGFDGIVGTFDIPRKVVPCWSLFKAAYVDILGNIRPCCYSHKMKCGVIDNNTIRFTTEEKDDYVVESNMKKLHLEGKIPNECSKCLRYQI